MKNEYLIPGILAVILAALFPIYWINEALLTSWESWDSMQNIITPFGISDVIFLVIAAISIVVYWNFKKILNDQLNFKSLDILLLIMIALCILFFGTLSIVALIGSFGSPELIANDSRLASLSMGVVATCMILFGIVDILIGAVLLKHRKTLPSILLVLAIVSIIQGLFEITLVFSFGTLLTFPMYLIILAVHFLKTPESIEVV